MKYLIDESPDLILDAYDKMCEIIHPTGILIYDAQDLNTHYDYREIYNSIGGSKFFYINLLAIFYKMFTLLWYLENSEKFIAEFNMESDKIKEKHFTQRLVDLSLKPISRLETFEIKQTEIES